jgi:pimeloyl-ACP methyl ester carboxylesterase
VASYSAWQDWLRTRQPPLQVLWGRYDPSFQVEEAEAYRRDVPDAKGDVVDVDEHFVFALPVGDLAQAMPDLCLFRPGRGRMGSGCRLG